MELWSSTPNLAGAWQMEHVEVADVVYVVSKWVVFSFVYFEDSSDKSETATVILETLLRGVVHKNHHFDYPIYKLNKYIFMTFSVTEKLVRSTPQASLILLSVLCW